MVYPAICSDAPDGEREVAPRLKEQAEAEELLAEMEKLHATSAEFEQKLEKLHRGVLEHAEAKEKYIFPLLRALEHPEEQVQLGTRYEKAKSSAPRIRIPMPPTRRPVTRCWVPSPCSSTRRATPSKASDRGMFARHIVPAVQAASPSAWEAAWETAAQRETVGHQDRRGLGRSGLGRWSQLLARTDPAPS